YRQSTSPLVHTYAPAPETAPPCIAALLELPDSHLLPWWYRPERVHLLLSRYSRSQNSPELQAAPVSSQRRLDSAGKLKPPKSTQLRRCWYQRLKDRNSF